MHRLAAVGTIIIGQIIIVAHRDVVTPGWLNGDAACTETHVSKPKPKSGQNNPRKKVRGRNRHILAKDQIMNHAFKINGNTTVRLGRISKCLGIIPYIATFLVICVGCSMTAFAFNVEGLAGIALDWIENGNRRKELSLLSTGGSLGAQADGDPAQVLGLTFIQIVFFTATFLIPILQQIALAFLWAAPLTLAQQMKMVFV